MGRLTSDWGTNGSGDRALRGVREHFGGQSTSGDRALGDRDRALGDRDRALGDRDRALGDRALGDRALGDRALGDRALGDRALGDRALGDRACVGTEPLRGQTAREHAWGPSTRGDRACVGTEHAWGQSRFPIRTSMERPSSYPQTLTMNQPPAGDRFSKDFSPSETLRSVFSLADRSRTPNASKHAKM